MNYVLIVKVVERSLITSSKMFHITTPRDHSKHQWSCHNV